MLTNEQRKELCERMPYLIPRSVWTDKIADNYNYEYIRGENELPEGWFKLFLQLCEDIRQPLIDANYLDKFRFTQIKEKYNTMRCYNYGAPAKVHRIISMYEYVSSFVCTKCGQPATMETQGWLASYCDNCWKDYARHEICVDVAFDPIMHISGYKNGEEYTEEVNCSDIWARLYGIKGDED